MVRVKKYFHTLQNNRIFFRGYRISLRIVSFSGTGFRRTPVFIGFQGLTYSTELYLPYLSAYRLLLRFAPRGRHKFGGEHCPGALLHASVHHSKSASADFLQHREVIVHRTLFDLHRLRRILLPRVHHYGKIQ